MPSAKYDFKNTAIKRNACEQGADFNFVFTWKDQSNIAINLSGYSARMQVRLTPQSASPVLDLLSGSAITLGGAAGTISISISNSQTSGLSPGEFYYDLVLTSGTGVKTRLVEGVFEVTASVTR